MTIVLLALLAGCPSEEPTDLAQYWPEQIGGPALLMDASLQESFERGRAMMDHAFTPSTGLGPTFNADSCGSCHQSPVAGGSGPRYRDTFLVYRQRFDGSLEGVGTNGSSPVRNLYAVAPSGHIAEPDDTVVYARRQVPSGLGVGLFAFVSDQDILANEDILDKDGDGISGRANYEQGRVGRFGHKAQAATLESFNRGAIFNHMGITSDPLFYDIPGAPDALARAERESIVEWLLPTAFAQVGALTEPTRDDDGVADPEMSNSDQQDLLVFSTFVGTPRIGPLDDEAKTGELLFGVIGCEACHLPSLPSTVGELPAYTDLLLHDMGDALDDSATMGIATGREYRTTPLWGVSLHGPYLHDGRADTLMDAIVLHGGEAQASTRRFEALGPTEQGAVIAFLRALGGGDVNHQNLVLPGAESPAVGQVGGPVAGLSAEQLAQFDAGRADFDRNALVRDGLGPHFNADSCRACHRDPAVGGAGGIDVNTIRYGRRDISGAYFSLERDVLPRQSVPGGPLLRLPNEANIVELRNPPTLLGVGLLDNISQDAILLNADPTDRDGDGISGRTRMLVGGVVGRFGWKAGVSTASDVVAHSLLHKNGLTIDPTLSGFTIADDDDGVADPEVSAESFADLVFFVTHLAPPPRREPVDAAAAQRGEASFEALNCTACHLPLLDGVAAFTDLLLHDVAPDPLVLVEQDGGVAPTEYRTPPLWGVSQTGPWLHDGSAQTIADAVLLGHYGEASASRLAFEALSQTQRDELIAYLNTL